MIIQELEIISFDLDISTTLFTQAIHRFCRSENRTVDDNSYIRDAGQGRQYDERIVLLMHKKELPKGRGKDVPQFKYIDTHSLVTLRVSEIKQLAEQNPGQFISGALALDLIAVVAIGLDRDQSRRLRKLVEIEQHNVNPVDRAEQIKVKMLPLNLTGANFLRNLLGWIAREHDALSHTLLPFTKVDIVHSEEFDTSGSSDEFYGIEPPSTTLPDDWFAFRDEIRARGGQFTLKQVAKHVGMRYGKIRKLHSSYLDKQDLERTKRNILESGPEQNWNNN